MQEFGKIKQTLRNSLSENSFKLIFKNDGDENNWMSWCMYKLIVWTI